MKITEVKFTGSFDRQSKAPAPDRPEYAFIGRSNVGKSSLINFLSMRKDLAHVSQKPGKTQTINFFTVFTDKCKDPKLAQGTWWLVDLPGYGYAKVSKTQRVGMERMIRDYVVLRENLQCVFVLIDVRIPPQQLDIEYLTDLGTSQIPFAIVFTKADKITPLKLNENIDAFKASVLEVFEELPPVFVTSAAENKGRDELLQFIDDVNSRYIKP